MQSWKRFEYRIVGHLRKLGWHAHRVPVSGSASVIKGDVIASRNGVRLRIDAKSTASKDAIRISVADIEKNIASCTDGEIPLVVFSFRKHRRLYALLDAERAGLFPRHRRKELRSAKSLRLRKSDLADIAGDECILLSLAGCKRYTVAELDSALARLLCEEGCV